MSRLIRCQRSLFFLCALCALAAIVTASVSTPIAEARASRVASYSLDRVWPTAVRFLRIDLGYKIVERDAEAGYVIFEYSANETTYRGSLELVKTTDYASRDSVKLIVEISDRPEYEEAWVIEKMIERLREDLGQPIDKKDEDKPKPAPKEDGDKDKDKDEKAKDEKARQ